MHKLPDDANELIAHFRVKADEARSNARAVAWHDVRLSYEAIAENYEQLAEGAVKLARLLNGCWRNSISTSLSSSTTSTQTLMTIFLGWHPLGAAA